MDALADLVGDVAAFGLDTWGRRARHWQRCHAGPAVFGVGDVDRILTSATRTPAVRLVRDGQRIEPDRFCSPTRIGNATLPDVVDARKVIDEYRRGSTVVLQALHRTWAPVSAWCAALEAELGWPVQCNAYLTPPGTAGLARHTDGHDVFAVQLFGAKHWDVEGVGDVELAADHVLYIPAGTEHDAETRHAASLHLTVGVHRPSAERTARAALAAASEQATASTGAAPIPLGADADLTHEVSAAAEAARSALALVDAEAVAARLRRPPRQHLGGIVEAAVRRGPIAIDTLVEVAAGVDPVLSADRAAGDARLRCEWSGGSLSMPAFTEPAMRALVDAGRARRSLPVAALPGLDDEDRIVLVRRLVDEGVLAVVTA